MKNNNVMKYLLIILSVVCFISCKVCKKKVGRTVVEVTKENLVCTCNSLKSDTLLGKKIGAIEKSNARYLLGPVLLNKEKKGIYQYVKTGSGIRGNMFIYYNGFDVYLLDKENLISFTDSLYNLGITKKHIDKTIIAVKKSMDVPAENTTDSF